jgi:hypothetical protein
MGLEIRWRRETLIKGPRSMLISEVVDPAVAHCEFPEFASVHKSCLFRPETSVLSRCFGSGFRGARLSLRY